MIENKYTQEQLIEIRKQIFSKMEGCIITAGQKFPPILTNSGTNSDYYNSHAAAPSLAYKVLCKSLASITDDDKLAYETLTGNKFQLVEFSTYIYCHSIILAYRGLQYLEAKGYALPKLIVFPYETIELSVEEQVLLNIIQLIP